MTTWSWPKMALCVVVLGMLAFVPIQRQNAQIQIGSKKFTESVILGEILTILGQQQKISTLHLKELGGTRLLFDSLVHGEIDLYPEYIGTIEKEILAGDSSEEAIEIRLEKRGLRLGPKLGFNNTYALAMAAATARQLKISRISDLKNHLNLRFGFSNEFLDRGDGWKSLQAHYRLPHQEVRGMDHDIAYRQLAAGSIDVIDVYTTDAAIVREQLVVLEDDLQFFPRYDAVILYRTDLEERFPKFVEMFRKIRIDEPLMMSMNQKVDSGEQSEAQVAGDFLAEMLGIAPLAQKESWQQRVWQRTIEHVDLVRKSMFLAIVIGLALGIIAFQNPRCCQLILAVTGLFQTIPAIALLVLLIPVAAALGLQSLGLASQTAIFALVAYSLLPIVRNTVAGLEATPRDIEISAVAIGLSPATTFLKVRLPLASPTILAGISTAMVQNIGFAALGALIGAGGYGQTILTGIRLNSTALILEGAIPAALLAVLSLFLFSGLERILIPRGIRKRAV
ncbi:MAG: glycine betaine ABC transporter substrate-binding protein [Zavarzinella sp.]